MLELVPQMKLYQPGHCSGSFDAMTGYLFSEPKNTAIATFRMWIVLKFTTTCVKAMACSNLLYLTMCTLRYLHVHMEGTAPFCNWARMGETRMGSGIVQCVTN